MPSGEGDGVLAPVKTPVAPTPPPLGCLWQSSLALCPPPTVGVVVMSFPPPHREATASDASRASVRAAVLSGRRPNRRPREALASECQRR